MWIKHGRSGWLIARVLITSISFSPHESGRTVTVKLTHPSTVRTACAFFKDTLPKEKDTEQTTLPFQGLRSFHSSANRKEPVTHLVWGTTEEGNL